MANNVDILDGAGATKTVKTTDNAGVHTPHHNVDSSALPTGAATSAKQDTIIGHVDGIEALLGTMDTDTGSIATSATSIDGKITACNTGAVVISSSAMPTGAATSANQTTIIGHLDGVETLLGTIDTDTGNIAVSAASIDGKITACNTGAVVISSGSLTANAGTNLNTSALALEAGGNLAAAAASLSVMDDWDNAASDGASVSGDVAHDTADAGEPVKVGFKATTSLAGLTLVADADRTNGFAGIDGVQVVRTHCNLEDIVSGNASNTDGTSTQCIAAGAAGIKHYITRVTITNTSASNIYVEIKDGATAKHTVPVPANAGATIGFDPPLPGSAATAWNFDPSSAATTIYCSMVGFKSKI